MVQKKCHNVTFFEAIFEKVSHPKPLDFIGFSGPDVKFCDVFYTFFLLRSENNVKVIILYINKKRRNFCHKRHSSNFL